MPTPDRKIPLSENERKFHADWTKEDCINELRRVALIDPARAITRNYFRNVSEISEATWNRSFGTFSEFKRQAGLVLSRHAHRLERDIAKHASVDVLRELNLVKRQWEGKFLRPSSRRWQTTLVFNDVHDIHCDPFFRRVLISTVVRVQPEKIVINGDLFDLPEFSKHFQDPRKFQLLERIRWVHAFLHELREACPEAEIILVEGNHEFRLLRHMAEETPALMVVLADLHGFTVPKLLGLDKFAINYIARADITAWTEQSIKHQLASNTIRLYDNSLLLGHFPEMRNMGLPGATGHHHKHIVWSTYNPIHGPSEWHQVGCGHLRQASYCAGEKWANGFLLIHTDLYTKRSQFEYLDLSHQGAMVGGTFYVRSDQEIVTDTARPL